MGGEVFIMERDVMAPYVYIIIYLVEEGVRGHTVCLRSLVHFIIYIAIIFCVGLCDH